MKTEASVRGTRLVTMVEREAHARVRRTTYATEESIRVGETNPPPPPPPPPPTHSKAQVPQTAPPSAFRPRPSRAPRDAAGGCAGGGSPTRGGRGRRQRSCGGGRPRRTRSWRRRGRGWPRRWRSWSGPAPAPLSCSAASRRRTASAAA